MRRRASFRNRVIHWRARWVLLWSTKIHPSPLQKEFNRGDPHGIVARVSEEIIREIESEEK